MYITLHKCVTYEYINLMNRGYIFTISIKVGTTLSRPLYLSKVSIALSAEKTKPAIRTYIKV